MPDTKTIEPTSGTKEATPPGRDRPSAPAPAKRRQRRPLLWVLVLAVLAGGGWWAVHFVQHMLTFESTDDAFLRGHVHQVGPRVAGTVTEVLVKDHAVVKAGQVLARLDATEFQIALEKAKAALAQARANETQAQADVAQAGAQAAQAQAQVKVAEAQVTQSGAEQETAAINLNRNQTLFRGDSRAVSKADVDTARGTAESMRGALDAARAGVEAAQAQVKASEAAQAAAQGKLEAARAATGVQEAAVRDAERELSYVEIKAPADGQIGNKSVESGERVQVGQVLFALVERHTWVVANFKETQLERMRVGQPAEVTVDALGGRVVHGRVESFAPATGAQFALLPPDNATGNFTKVVQRVPVKITFDADAVQGLEDRLQPGLSAVVDVRVK